MWPGWRKSFRYIAHIKYSEGTDTIKEILGIVRAKSWVRRAKKHYGTRFIGAKIRRVAVWEKKADLP